MSDAYQPQTHGPERAQQCQQGITRLSDRRASSLAEACVDTAQKDGQLRWAMVGKCLLATAAFLSPRLLDMQTLAHASLVRTSLEKPGIHPLWVAPFKEYMRNIHALQTRTNDD
jgi:hypothetical protein